jgi:hypothetical protein
VDLELWREWHTRDGAVDLVEQGQHITKLLQNAWGPGQI